MPDPVAVSAVLFQEAIDYQRSKVGMPSRAWTDLWEGMHARSFVVAGATKAALVADLKAAVDKALAEGRTIADFRKDFDTIVQRHGWDYNGERGWRTRTILETNLRTAYAAGKWQQAQATKDRRPYLRYVAVLDRRTRPDHRGWHGTVLPIDAAWWATHYPPCGWGCRCTVQTLSDRDLTRYGYSVSDEPEVEWVDRRVTTPDGATTVQVPKGIDPGWAYNPGAAGLGTSEARMAFERHGPWEALEAPGHKEAPPLPPLEAVKPAAKLGPRARPGDPDHLRRLWREGVGADSVTLKDPLGDRVQLSQAVVEHMLEEPRRQDGREAVFPQLRELVEHPAEIWVGFARSAVSGRVMLRRRYVRLFDTGKERVVALVADLDNGVWSGLTTMPAQPRYLKALRIGVRVYDELAEE